jgi:hypothetical protein
MSVGSSIFEYMFESEASSLISDVAATWREEAAKVAHRLDCVADLVEIRTLQAEDDDPDAGYMIITGLHRTSADLAAALNLGPDAASLMVAHAVALRERLPRVRDLLAAGRADWATVAVILTRTEHVAESVAHLVDADLAQRLEQWHSWSRRRLIRAIDAAIRTHDPDAVRERERAQDRRYVRVTPLANGTARLDAVLTADAAAALGRRLADHIGTVCPHDPRTADQRRADAIGTGAPLHCQCHSPDCTATVNPLVRPVRVVINVVAEADTLAGQNDNPALIAGYGVIDAAHLRELATDAAHRLLVEPTVTEAESLRYQPSAALARWIRIRDLTCRFPGCDRPAEVCDLDHTIAFNHADPAAGGRTVAINMKCLCRQHHRQKTFDKGWRDQQLPDGTIVWTAPDGRVYRTTPGGADLFDVFGRTDCREPAPPRRRPTRAARRERARARNRRLRPINEAARSYTFATRRELRHRADRNHMRRLKHLFKGDEPSTSPWCTYVNDPMEPEELPPDWRPPPPSIPDPDEPPF